MHPRPVIVSVTDRSIDRQMGEKPLFRVGDAVFTWDDVVERARLSGEWSALEDEVRAGLAALDALERRGESPDEDDVEEAARAFRYARGLLAGDELDAWLDAHGLTVETWKAYLCRSLASDLVDEPERRADVPAAAPEPTDVWAEGVCSGSLEELARELAALVAVAPDAPPDERDDRYDTFCVAAATEAAIAREIESNRLEWLRVHYDAVVFADEDSAAEAALCVRADGDPLAAVAARVGAELEECLDWMDEVEPELRARFLAAEPGDLVGPVPTEEGFTLAALLEKMSPSVDDEDVRARAADALGFRAASRAVDDLVVWLEPL
jgi:hypothetical protein